MKHVIITGTSRGIGFELAQQFAKNNFQVLALSRNKKPLDDLKLKNITTLSVDVCKQEDIEKVSNFIQENWQEVDILIHNAGFLINKPFENLTKNDFLRVYDVNVFGVAELTRICIPFLKKGSHVVTISSMGGIQGSLKFPGLAAYSSSKAAIASLSECLAEELKKDNIKVNCLALGAVNTEMLSSAFPGYTAQMQPKDMAKYIVRFAMKDYQFINGKIIPISFSTP